MTRTDSWIPVSSFDVPPTDNIYWSGLSFHPAALQLAILTSHDCEVEIWSLDKKKILQQPATASSLRYINAKMVLVGDSGVGKSALAFRIVENEFKLTESTHGARFWHMDLTDRLAQKDVGLQDAHIELTVWDLAGQPEYRLVHQLFLEDTDAALLLFDCTDSSDSFKGIRYWAKVLNKHAPQANKFLISSRTDVCPITVSDEEIRNVVKEYSLYGHYGTSAKSGDGLDVLMENLVKAIPWNSLPRTTTPLLFKTIRDYLLDQKTKGNTLITADEVRRNMANGKTTEISEAQFDTVINLLQSRGFVYRLTPTPTSKYILLKPELLNSYASSVIQAARNSAHGIGAIPEHDVVFGSIKFDGFTRVGYYEELILLQCAIELLIKYDLCFREMGHLVFPSQISIGRPKDAGSTLPEVSYFFSGSIEIIYASLVVRLSYTDYFHLEDRWRYSAEFSRNNKRLGFVMENVKEDISKLGIYFDPAIDDFDRVSFIRFIMDHLKLKGLDVKEHIRVMCSCGQEISDKAAIEARIKSGNLDIPCQYCGTLVIIPKSIEEHYRKNFDYVKLQHELIKIADQRTREEVSNFNADREEYTKPSGDGRLIALHLSDFHLENIEDAKRYRFQLESDLKRELKINKLDFLIVSGDIANKATKEDYEAAFYFVDGLAKRFGLDGNRVIVAPGNHDVNWDLSEEAYEFVPARRRPGDLTDGSFFHAGKEGFLIRDENSYKKRFDNFNHHFFKKVQAGIEYPVEYSNQGLVRIFEKEKMIFLSLNSAWETDHHFDTRYSVNNSALINAIDSIGSDCDDYLKLVVLHHPASGPEMIPNVGFLEHLAIAGFKIYLHGHVHHAEENLYKYDNSRSIHLIGAGTFGAPINQMTPAIPLQYNILRINRTEASITVETRKKETANGAWSADARWGDKNKPVPFYKLTF